MGRRDRAKHGFLAKQMTKLTPEEEEAEQLRRYGIADETSPGKRPGGPTKYRPIMEGDFGEDGKIRLPGRHRCECQARAHGLINNCLRCGRVVCDQEGSGPCFFCGALVATADEEARMAQDTKKGRELRLKLMGGLQEPASSTAKGRGKSSESGGSLSLASIGSALYAQAERDKDRLLSFDRDSARRTKVIDDQSDYFSDSTWLSPEARAAAEARREELRNLRHGSRSQKKLQVSLDFAGREVREEQGQSYTAVEAAAMAELEAAEELERARRFAAAAKAKEAELGLAAPNIAFRPLHEAAEEATGRVKAPAKLSGRVQDGGGFEEMAEAGWCLSLHQPHASLLVRGIKRHEGRAWPADFRGPLWIHAGGKPIDREDIEQVEAFYRNFYGGNLPAALPIQYPNGCVVGQVTVSDVLSQEEYETAHPNGESESAFVFICESPLELPFHIPTPGGPKIFRLPTNITAALNKAKALAKHY